MGTTLPRENLPEEIYKKSKTLNKEQVSQVLDFIEFIKLKGKKGLRRNPLIEFITAEADPEMTLDAVRQQLSGIKGNLADTIINGREERVWVRVGEIDEENFMSLRKLFSQDIKRCLYEVAEFANTEKLESTKLLLKYAKKHSLKTLDAIQLSVVKSVNEPEVKAVVCADEKFCKIIALEGFSVINPLIGDN